MRRSRWCIRRPSPPKQIEISLSAELNPTSITVCAAQQFDGIDGSVPSFDPPEQEAVCPLPPLCFQARVCRLNDSFPMSSEQKITEKPDSPEVALAGGLVLDHSRQGQWVSLPLVMGRGLPM